jgi:DNA-binding LacI/PurR family transcriptional regulator
MKITLQDISKDTGFSLSTVSRVLNGSDKYAEETRSAVLDSARKLNYGGLKVRSGMMPKTHLKIALITDFHEGEFYASYFYGFTQASEEKKVRVSLIGTSRIDEIIREHIGIFSDQYYDGAVIFIPGLDRKDYELIAREIPEGFPLVSNALIENPVLTTVTFDGYSGGHLAAAYFKDRGYKRLGIVKGPPNKAESRFRYNGFIDYIAQDTNLELVFEAPGNFNYDTGANAYEAFKVAEVKPEAIFLANDLMCHGFIEAAKSDGLVLPDQIALLGYDDLPMCVHSSPRISSIRTDFKALASASLQALIDLKSNPNSSNGMLSLVPISIIAREST